VQEVPLELVLGVLEVRVRQVRRVLRVLRRVPRRPVSARVAGGATPIRPRGRAAAASAAIAGARA
jgi:hypothetical protein